VFLEPHDESDESGEEVAICLQYRGLLFAALKQTAHTLSFQASGGNGTAAAVAVANCNGAGNVRKEDGEGGKFESGRLFWFSVF
jgi:hypothetical protein